MIRLISKQDMYLLEALGVGFSKQDIEEFINKDKESSIVNDKAYRQIASLVGKAEYGYESLLCTDVFFNGSVRLIKHYEEMQEQSKAMDEPVVAAVLAKGHPVQILYSYGELSDAVVYEREGRQDCGDIVPGYVEGFEESENVEIRGILTMVQEMRSVICYQIKIDKEPSVAAQEGYEMLKRNGFTIPTYVPTQLTQSEATQIVKTLVEGFEGLMEHRKIQYPSYGIAILTETLEGTMVNMGAWHTDVHEAKVIGFEYKLSATQLIPSAKIEAVYIDGLMITNVPIHTVGMMIQHSIVVGDNIYFTLTAGGEVRWCTVLGEEISALSGI